MRYSCDLSGITETRKREIIERVGLWRSLEKVRYIDLWLQYFENTNRAYQSKDFAFSRLRHRPTRALEHHVRFNSTQSA